MGMLNATSSNPEMPNPAACVEVPDVKIGRHYWSATVYVDGSARVYCDGDYAGAAMWDASAGRLEGCYGLSGETALDEATAAALAA